MESRQPTPSEETHQCKITFCVIFVLYSSLSLVITLRIIFFVVDWALSSFALIVESGYLSKSSSYRLLISNNIFASALSFLLFFTLWVYKKLYVKYVTFSPVIHNVMVFTICQIYHEHLVYIKMLLIVSMYFNHL